MGIDKTYSAIHSKYYSLNLYKDVTDYVNECVTCQLTLSCTITAFHVPTLSVQSRLLTCLPYPYNHGFSLIYRIRTITAFHVSHFQR